MRCLDEDRTYVALVRGFQSAPKVRRFYRPEDTVAGRKPFYGSRELFLTDHYDSQEACTIEGKCIVHSFTTYTGHSPDYVVTPNDYFSCSEYQTETGWFLSDAIEVVCKCEMPVNPDVFMLKCQACRELWNPSDSSADFSWCAQIGS
ncbi:chromatin remodeling protein EBS-like protein [Tanacetum coccineum]